MERYREKVELTFKRIKNENIFEWDFQNLIATGNAIIEVKQHPRRLQIIVLVRTFNENID